MLMFWIVAGLFLAGALLLLLPSLLQARPAGPSAAAVGAIVLEDQRREVDADLAGGWLDAHRASESQAELQRRRQDDGGADTARTVAPRPAWRSALLVALFVPAASLWVYGQLGRPDAVLPAVPGPKQAAGTGAAPGGAAGHALTPEQIQQRATALAERLKAQPADAEGWVMLSRSYTALSRYRDAAAALRRAADLLPPDASLLADLADVTGMAQGRRLAGEPARLIQAALDLDPRHGKALALAGSVAFEARDYAAARGYWERLLAVLPPESPLLRGVRSSLAQAARLESGAAASEAAAAPAGGQAGEATAATSVSGEVFISPALKARLAAGDTLFVFARAAEGQRVPLAVQRLAVGLGQDRYAFALDDRMAMGPNLRISAFARVVVSARVSRSGVAAAQSGDLVGSSEPVTPGTTGVRVLVDRVQP
ncbi:MAG: c-type cytochrome biogenesis protein CcmI [Rubrivivax sp.]|nr:c-type cytochrome biogenesis protein CcmI [Rubrivivax sp.]